MDRQTSHQESITQHVRIIQYPLGIDDFMLSVLQWIKSRQSETRKTGTRICLAQMIFYTQLEKGNYN